MDTRRWVRLSTALLLVLTGCASPAKTETAAPPTEPVAAAPPPPTEPAPPPAVPAPSATGATAGATSRDFIDEPALKDVYFESGRVDIGPQGTLTMRSNARWLIEHAGYLVLIEGHTDATGTAETNVAIGERRAKSAMAMLVKGGVASERIQTTSYGSTRPVCTETTDACAAQNRRVHFLVKQ